MNCTTCKRVFKSDKSYREEQDKNGKPTGKNYCNRCFIKLDGTRKMILKTIQDNSKGVRIAKLCDTTGLPQRHIRNFLKNSDMVYDKPDFDDLRGNRYFLANGVKIE